MFLYLSDVWLCEQSCSHFNRVLAHECYCQLLAGSTVVSASGSVSLACCCSELCAVLVQILTATSGQNCSAHKTDMSFICSKHVHYTA